MPNQPVSGNSTGTLQSVSFTSEGTTTYHIQWIGIGPAPQKILVKVNSGAYYTVGGGAPSNLTLDNGLGSLSHVYRPSMIQNGTKTRVVPLDQGVYKIVLKTKASATTVGVNAAASASADGTSIEIAPKGVTIIPWGSPTYTQGPQDAPVPLQNIDSTDIRINTAIMEGGTYHRIYGMFTAGLWGQWSNPVNYSWTVDSVLSSPSHVQYGDTTAYQERLFTPQEVADILLNGPIPLTSEQLTATDINFSGNAKATIWAYAPQMFPTLHHEVMHDNYVRVSDFIHRTPYGTTPISNTISHAHAVTKQLTIGGGTLGGLPVPQGSPLTLALSIPTFQYGQTATITKTLSIGYTLNAGPDDRVFWIEKRNKWGEAFGSHLMYGPAGYEGLGLHRFTYWLSGSKESAELIDHEWHLKDSVAGGA